MIRIAVLDDHPAVLAGLQRLVERADDLTPVAFVETTERLREVLDACRVDVVVVDFDLARGDGLMACVRLKDRARPPRVIIYSAYAGDALALAARAAGADGLVHKSEPVARLLTAIRTVAQGRTVLPDVAPEVQQSAMSRLGDDDVAVAAMLLAGTPPDAIADTLGLERRAVAAGTGRIVARLRPHRANDDAPLPRSDAWAREPTRAF